MRVASHALTRTPTLPPLICIGPSKVLHLPIDMPENPMFAPTLRIDVVDERPFGARALLGAPPTHPRMRAATLSACVQCALLGAPPTHLRMRAATLCLLRMC